MAVDFQQTTQCYIPEDITFYALPPANKPTLCQQRKKGMCSSMCIWILLPHHYSHHWVFSVGAQVKSDNMQCQITITEGRVHGVLLWLFTDNFVLSPDLFNDWTKNKINYCRQSDLIQRNATVLCLLSASCWFLTWLTLQTWRWRQYILWNSVD
jgi:hypothetical protein